MEDRDKRSSIFTVQDAESAMIWLTIVAIGGLIWAYLHEFSNEQGCLKTLYATTNHIPKIISIATMVILLKEGVDIMFRRVIEVFKNEARAEERGIAKGRSEVYQELAAWDNRRREAQARNEPFNEPPPVPSQAPPK